MNQSVSIHHHVSLIPQPTNMTCWYASTMMLLRMTPASAAGNAQIGADGGLKPATGNIERFARHHGLRLHYMQSWSVAGLVSLLESGPFSMWGKMPSRHVVVVTGIDTDGSPGNTLLTINDPWPVGIGAVRRYNYDSLMRNFPTVSDYVMQK